MISVSAFSAVELWNYEVTILQQAVGKGDPPAASICPDCLLLHEEKGEKNREDSILVVCTASQYGINYCEAASSRCCCFVVEDDVWCCQHCFVVPFQDFDE